MKKNFAFSINLFKNDYGLNGNESIIHKNFTSSLIERGSLGTGSIILRVGETLVINPNQTPQYMITSVL